ncbi:MAG: hypothetical protein BWY80_00137 [Firmicutes bacterium ADurb.Bin456]|nr:MAG: hypothetical protein BWY80_00137 [Firmicutes bacterium ADurb.Bin456]
MAQLSGMLMYEFLSGGRIATVYHFYKKGVKIIGFASGSGFKIKVLTIGHNPPRKGLGQAALVFLRPLYKKISVIEIYLGALPFWLKMKERGLVDHLESVKEGRRLYPLKGMPVIESNLKRIKSKNSWGYENFASVSPFNPLNGSDCEPVAYI